jgi:hypothetical protein
MQVHAYGQAKSSGIRVRSPPTLKLIHWLMCYFETSGVTIKVCVTMHSLIVKYHYLLIVGCMHDNINVVFRPAYANKYRPHNRGLQDAVYNALFHTARDNPDAFTFNQ